MRKPPAASPGDTTIPGARSRRWLARLSFVLAFVAVATHGLGLNDKFSYNVANIIGIGVATIFRLYCYRRWVFLMANDEAFTEHLQPETSSP